MCCFLANGASSLATVGTCCNIVFDTGLRYKGLAVIPAAVGPFVGFGVVLDLLIRISCNQLVFEQYLHVVEEDLAVTAFGRVQRFVSDSVFEEVCQAFATVVAVAESFEILVSCEE